MIFFTSDHHFSHANVIKYCKRPYQNIEEMNQDMVRLWNETVAPTDTVYYLGDFSLWKLAPAKYLPMLNGEKHLIAGNHDWCHPVHYKKKPQAGEKFRKLYYEAGFKSIKTEDEIIIKSMDNPRQFTVRLHHLPYTGKDSDHTYAERYTEYRPIDKGQWLLCGHVHDTWAQRGRMINVGVDVRDFKPISLDEIYKIMLNGPKDL